MFREIGIPALRTFNNNENVSIFAYGATGSGKTYSVFGENNNPGLAERLLTEVFTAKTKNEVQVSFFEIHLEKVRDLLFPAENNLQVRSDLNNNVYIEGLSKKVCGSSVDAIKQVELGLR